MFLLNIFSRSSTHLQQQHYDRITFKVNLSDNVPEYHELHDELTHEQQFTPEHPLYYDLFPRQQSKFIEYTVTENDTLFGIAIKLELNEQIIRDMNNLSGNIYPGMIIKLPQDIDIAKLTQQPNQQTAKLRISQLLSSSQTLIQSNCKYQASYYAGMSGYIRGVITVNPNYVIFNPCLDCQDNTSRFTIERLLKFNAIIQTQDLQDCLYLEIPEMGDAELPRIISVVQFMLYKVGNAKIERKYKQRLKQLKIDHKAIASMSFALQGENPRGTGQQLVAQLKSIIQSIQSRNSGQQPQQQRNRLTSIPFFDIIHQNIQTKTQQPSQQSLNKIIHPSAILGSLIQPSEILTNEQFSKLVLSFPLLYQLQNWTKVYCMTRDGSNFSTLLSKVKNVEPAILLIKEYKGYNFGAFLIESLQTGKTGRGEMFIFTFKDQPAPKVYQWTNLNQSFVFVQKDSGIGIGMGFKHGIFIKHTLDKGSSASTITFGNQDMLSRKEDFAIQEIEVWGVDSAY